MSSLLSADASEEDERLSTQALSNVESTSIAEYFATEITECEATRDMEKEVRK